MRIGPATAGRRTVGDITETRATSPTVTELFDAAWENYSQSGVAADLTPFLVGGKQLQITDTTAGVVADVWLTPAKQVVIAYEGTLGNTPAGPNPAFLISQILDDAAIFSSPAPVIGETVALAFEKKVAADAAKARISASNIFVTGHSLGATLASYVAESTGDGGIGFESIGIGPDVGTKGNGSNFVSVDTYGDAIPAYASNETAIGAIAPAAGTQPLYGQVLHVGDPAWQAPLSAEAALLAPAALLAGKTGQVAAEIALFAANVLYHLPLTQAHALGVTPPPATTLFGAGLGLLGVTSGPVLPVANDTIPQLIAYIAATDGNTRAAATAPAGARPGFIDAMAALAPIAGAPSARDADVHAAMTMPLLMAASHGSHVMMA
jgi:hypothetical protein